MQRMRITCTLKQVAAGFAVEHSRQVKASEMGLDLLAIGRPRPGLEIEWRQWVISIFTGELDFQDPDHANPGVNIAPIEEPAAIRDRYETQFRGNLLLNCGAVLHRVLITAAWENRFADEALEYGDALVKAAGKARKKLAMASEARPAVVLGHFAGESPLKIPDQIELVQYAGEWLRFWGGRGHAICASY